MNNTIEKTKVVPDPKQTFIQAVRQSLEEQLLVKLTLGKYRGTADLKKVYVQLILVKGQPRVDFRWVHHTKDIHKNYDRQQAVEIIETELGTNFHFAALQSTQKILEIEYSKNDRARLRTVQATATDSPTIQPHNRQKQRMVEETSLFLKHLGLSDGKQIRSAQYDKYKQIDKFIEIFDSLIADSELLRRSEIQATDFGSGKSYLTFAMYDYLQKKFKGKLAFLGVEQRPELVEKSNQLATLLGFSGLSFRAEKIETHQSPKLDIVVALHACDTATDDAIKLAVAAQAEILLLAPCCQKYVRNHFKAPLDLQGIFKHGIHQERMAVMLTDGLRALWLEAQGYKVKVFEFVSLEHTARNTMIVAQRSQVTAQAKQNICQQIAQIKQQFGLVDFYLDRI